MAGQDMKKFDSKKKLVVAKSFRSNGRPLASGQEFNWRQMSVSERRVKQLFNHRFLVHSKDEESKVEKSVEAKVETDEVVEKPIPPKKSKSKKEKKNGGK